MVLRPRLVRADVTLSNLDPPAACTSWGMRVVGFVSCLDISLRGTKVPVASSSDGGAN
ncbi:hypothetical protein SBV1_1380005 [Verrucomicrobia bacterium]|nr:hypothetical protein SBV1_1380005 [Verrucomicrobiota bacterium]